MLDHFVASFVEAILVPDLTSHLHMQRHRTHPFAACVRLFMLVSQYLI